MVHSPSLHVQAYIWEVSPDGRLAIIQHGKQFHVLQAGDTVNSLHEALQRVAEIERKFEAQEVGDVHDDA